MGKACIIENSLNHWNVEIHMAWKTWKISCFRKAELKSAVIFFKYILLNKISIPVAKASKHVQDDMIDNKNTVLRMFLIPSLCIKNVKLPTWYMIY